MVEFVKFDYDFRVVNSNLDLRNTVIRNLYHPQPRGVGWHFEAKTTRYYSFARHALAAAIDVLKMKSGDAILIPSLICKDVLSSFASRQIEVVFYDVDQALNPIAFPTKKNIRAILAVNYFGFAQNLEPFKNYCQTNNCFLIEDNAHGYLSSDEQGNWLGFRGDIGIFSYRKTIPVPFGAAIVTNRFQEDLPKPIGFQPGMNTSSLLKSSVRKLVPYSGILPVTLSTRIARKFRKTSTENSDVLPTLEKAPDSLLKAISTSDSGFEIRRRRELYQIIEPLILRLGGQPLFSNLPKNTAPYTLPFLADEKNYQIISENLNRIGLECFSWPELPGKVEQSAPKFYHQVRCVRFLW
jgi:hypothetical protein